MDGLKKEVLKKPYKLLCAVALLLCVCKEIPEHCGNYVLIDPNTGKCETENEKAPLEETTPPETATPVIYHDRDGKKYGTVKIGTQNWMAENLNYDTADGTLSWCYDCAKYGRLYTWNAAKTACPSGWHLPSRDEWDKLAKSVGGTEAFSGDNHHWNGAGKALKSKKGWYNNGNGMDDYKFSALPGGYRSPNGKYYSAGDYGYWWTAAEYGSNAYHRDMDYNDDYLSEYYNDKSRAYSVRCLKDN